MQPETITAADRELIELAQIADEYGETFKRPKTAGEKVAFVAEFRRIGRGPTAYPEADSPDGLADFAVFKRGSETVSVYLSRREFLSLAQLAPQTNDRIALTFERVTMRDGKPFNRLSFAKAGVGTRVDWAAETRGQAASLDPNDEGEAAQDEDDIPF